MLRHKSLRLDPKNKYLQVALNGTMEDASQIILSLPESNRILIEAGTPLIKRYGTSAIKQIKALYEERLNLNNPIIEAAIKNFSVFPALGMINKALIQGGRLYSKNQINSDYKTAYIVADLKTMDRAETEVQMVAEAGASAAIALGSAPIETLNSFVLECEKAGLDAMIDMMNVEYPLNVLSALKKVPPIVILHRGVDEERLNKEKMIPLHEIRRIKGRFDILISIAGGDTIREVQRSIFNDADIVVIWKSVYHSTNDTTVLVNEFLKQIK